MGPLLFFRLVRNPDTSFGNIWCRSAAISIVMVTVLKRRTNDEKNNDYPGSIVVDDCVL
jgi:hypothetical protein